VNRLPPDAPDGLPVRGPSGETTAVLLDRARAGDDRALNRLCERLRPRLRQWASGRLPAGARSLTDTEDLVQDVLVQSIRRLSDFRPEHRGAFFAYLRTAVTNRIRDQIRRRDAGERALDGAEDPRDPFVSPLEQVVGREMLERYEAGLGRLSDSDREAIIARVELDLGYDEIAEMIGSASGHAARMKVSRALVKLAKEMGHGT
jgi:RNA polymerase sigma-70 factor (ECF subfamily)